MKVYKTLLDMDFGKILFESCAQTTTGKNIINKYQAHVMTSPVTCSVVNNFLKEAKMCLYDSGVNAIYNNIVNIINDNRYSWALASTCENILANESRNNFLNRKAAEQVYPLLEMSEQDIVSYIKSGALKGVMHVESFRNIAKSVFKNQPIIENNTNFTVVHPISLVECKGKSKYFQVLGNIFKVDMNSDTIEESLSKELSHDFLAISQLMESNYCKYINETETIEVSVRNIKYIINEQGRAKRELNGKSVELTVEQMREQNSIYIQTIPHTVRTQVESILETAVKLTENFNNICILDNVNIIYTDYDKFLLIEQNGNAYTKSLSSTHSTGWKHNGNISEAVNIIKKNTRVDLTENFKNEIENIIENVKLKEGNMIKESLRQKELSTRRNKIAELTERFKSDPIRLQVLANIAQDLNDCE